MTRLLAPDDRCAEVDVPYGRARRYRGTVLDVADPAHASALRQAGYTPAGLGGGAGRATGYRCGDCGFGAFFRTCGRCGGVCTREEGAR